jgi:hypothetical protein
VATIGGPVQAEDISVVEGQASGLLGRCAVRADSDDKYIPDIHSRTARERQMLAIRGEGRETVSKGVRGRRRDSSLLACVEGKHIDALRCVFGDLVDKGEQFAIGRPRESFCLPLR